jgi:hypothetical protein
MPDFHRTNVNDRSFIRGAARLLIAPLSTPRPVEINDVIDLGDPVAVPAVAPTYDAQTGWFDLGATKTGVQITINNAEETFDVDQIMGDIASQPTSWECSVGTQLAEFTTEMMQLAWEGSAISVDAAAVGGPEEEIGLGQPSSYQARRLAVLYQRPNGKIRGHFFHKVQRMPQESSVTFAKTGEQVSVPVRFRALADSTITDIAKRFYIVRDQMVGTVTGEFAPEGP